MTVEPEPAGIRLPERAVVSRGIEVTPRSIPVFDGTNVPDIQDAFVGNLNLVSGGEVTSVNGEVIQTDGILGSAKIRIDTRLEQITLAGEALAADKEQFGKGRLRGPRAVRELEQENRRTSQADNRVLSESRKRIREQQERIKKLCKERHITGDLQTTYDSMLVVEEYLANNNSADLQPVRQNLDALKWTRRTPTRERIEDLLDGARTAAQGYDEYKSLRIGQGEGDSRIKGLRDFEAEVQAVAERRNTNAADIKSRLEAAKAKAQDWEKKNAEFRNQDTPEQRRLKTSHALITRVEEYLDSHYVPDADRLTQVGTGLAQARENLAESKASLAKIAGIVGRRAAKLVLGIASRQALGDLEEKVADLESEQHRLVDPTSRLTQEAAPRELKDMVKKVQAPGFDVARIAPRERILAGAVTALLGRGIVTVDKQATEEETPLQEGGVPEVAGPAEGDLDTGSESLREQRSINPEAIQPGQPARVVALYGMTGLLRGEELQKRPINVEAQRINDDLVDHFDTMEADLKNSLEASERGNPGISRNDLAELTVDALKRVATYLMYDPTESVNVDIFAMSLDRLSNENQAPEEKAKLERAKRLLAVAETAYRLGNG